MSNVTHSVKRRNNDDYATVSLVLYLPIRNLQAGTLSNYKLTSLGHKTKTSAKKMD